MMTLDEVEGILSEKYGIPQPALNRGEIEGYTVPAWLVSDFWYARAVVGLGGLIAREARLRASGNW